VQLVQLERPWARPSIASLSAEYLLCAGPKSPVAAEETRQCAGDVLDDERRSGAILCGPTSADKDFPKRALTAHPLRQGGVHGRLTVRQPG